LARHIQQGNATDLRGDVITDATVTVYLANTTTAVTAYAAVSGGSSVGSVQTDSKGYYKYFIDDSEYSPSQRFKHVISKTGYTSITEDYLEIIPGGATGIVYPEQFGVVDGTADEVQINLAIASLTSGGIVQLSGNTTYTTSTSGIALTDLSDITIRGAGGTVIDGSAVTTGNKILDITGSLSGTATTVDTSIAKGDTAISVVSSTGFTVGQMVFLYTATEAFSENDATILKGELAVITAVSAGQVDIGVGARDTYTTGSGVINIAEIDPIKNFQIENLKILGGGSASEHDGLVIYYALNPRVTNVEMEDVEDNGIVLGYTLNGVVDKSSVVDTDGGGATPGYAYSFTNATCDSKLINSYARNFRHAWTCAGLYATWNNLVSNNHFCHNVGNFGAITPHRNSARLSIVGNLIQDSFTGIQADGPNTLIANNNIQCNASDGYGIYSLQEGPLGLAIVNNTIFARRGIGISVYAGSNHEDVLIQGNTCRGDGFGGSVLHGITTM